MNVASSLSSMPAFVALTVKVTSSFTVASVPSLKVVPSVAMRIVAPSVAQENVTFVPLTTSPAAGEAVGVATFWVGVGGGTRPPMKFFSRVSL